MEELIEISEETTICLLPRQLAVLSVNKLGSISKGKACLKLNKIPDNRYANHSEACLWFDLDGQHSSWSIVKSTTHFDDDKMLAFP